MRRRGTGAQAGSRKDCTPSRNDFGQVGLCACSALLANWKPSCNLIHMTHRDLTQRYLLSALGLLFAASVGAFLYYVPMMSAIAVLTIAAGMICMFVLGFMARGSRRRQKHPPQALTVIHPLPDSKILSWPKPELPARIY
jgi:hypothetical protein